MPQKLLDRSSPEPLYRQLASIFEAQIAQGALAPGERIDTEDEISARYGVSRITVRQAVGSLVERNLLVRKQGKGTFVAVEPLRHDLEMPLLDALVGNGSGVSARLGRFERRVPPEAIAAEFGTAPGEELLYVERGYFRGETLVASAQGWLLAGIDPGGPTVAATMSTEQMILSSGLRVDETRTAIGAILSDESAALGGAGAIEPVLAVTRRRFGRGRLIEIADLHYLGRHCQLQLSAGGAPTLSMPALSMPAVSMDVRDEAR